MFRSAKLCVKENIIPSASTKFFSVRIWKTVLPSLSWQFKKSRIITELSVLSVNMFFSTRYRTIETLLCKYNKIVNILVYSLFLVEVFSNFKIFTIPFNINYLTKLYYTKTNSPFSKSQKRNESNNDRELIEANQRLCTWYSLLFVVLYLD